MVHTKHGRAASWAGRGIGILLVAAGPAAVVTGLPATAAADTTCYVGCTTEPPTVPTVPPSGGQGGQIVPAVAPTPALQGSSGGLAFTGADIAETATVGAAAVVGGAVLIRRGRRRRRMV